MYVPKACFICGISCKNLQHPDSKKVRTPHKAKAVFQIVNNNQTTQSHQQQQQQHHHRHQQSTVHTHINEK